MPRIPYHAESGTERSEQTLDLLRAVTWLLFARAFGWGVESVVESIEVEFC